MRRGRVISLLVAVGVVMSCIFDTPYEGACSDLNITLEFPASMATKSDVGQVPASDAENAVTDLTLWVFRSNDHEFVCSLRLPEEDSEAGFPQSGTVRRYTLPVPSSFALERPKIDVYVLVNAASVGKQDLRNSEDWDEVSTAFFGEDFFVVQTFQFKVKNRRLAWAPSPSHGRCPSSAMSSAKWPWTGKKVKWRNSLSIGLN